MIDQDELLRQIPRYYTANGDYIVKTAYRDVFHMLTFYTHGQNNLTLLQAEITNLKQQEAETHARHKNKGRDYPLLERPG